MPRGKAAMELDPNAAAEEIPEEAGGEGSASLFDASGDARVRVLRRDEKTQKMVTHGYMEPTVSEEKVSETFGGGHYRAQLWVPDPGGMPKVKRQRDFYIPGPYKPPQHINTMEDIGPNAPKRVDNNAAVTPAVPSVGGDDLMQVLKAGIINTLLEMMKSTKEMNNRPVPSTDPMLLEFIKSQSTVQSQMFTLMVTMMQNKNDAPRDTESKDYLGMLAKMKEIVTPANGGTPNQMEMFNTMLETFTRMREVATDIAPTPVSEDPIMGSLPKLAEVVYEQHQMNKARQQGQQIVPVRPVPGGAPTPEIHQVEQGPPPAIWQQVMRSQANRLVAQATAKSDPDVIAGAAILFAPPPVREALAIFFHRPSDAVMADMLAELPVMAEHREWLADFIDAAQFRLFPDEYSDEGEGEDSEAKDDDKAGR